VSRTEGSGVDRVIVVDKPAGMTSHDVVQRVRRAIRQRRIGHAGTLDPAATGVLVLLAGRATRLSQYLTAAEKEYEGRLVLGVATDTQDADGAVMSTADCSDVTETRLLECFGEFTGDLLQTPPMVSAVKRGGRRLYELAREGVEVARDPRPVTVRELELVGFEPPDVRFRVVCSKGTYVRTLAADIGARLGCGAHLGELRRTRSGDFGLAEALPLARLESRQTRPALPGRSLYDALADIPSVTLSERQLDQVLEGQPAEFPEGVGHPPGALVRATADGVHLTAIARVDEISGGDGALLKPIRVFGEESERETVAE